MRLTGQQIRFFDTFGYLVLPGLLRSGMGWIDAAFDALVAEGQVGQFLELDERFMGLLERGPLAGAAASLLGEDWSYVGSSGTVHSEHEVAWHTDSFIRAPGFLRVMVYLDPLEAGAGALHVIPGAHRPELLGLFGEAGGIAWDALSTWGAEARAVPNVGLAVNPGDVVLFDVNLPHASFGGGRRRRKIDITLSAPCLTQQQRDCLQHILEGAIEHRRDRVFRAETLAAAAPERMRRLAQALGFQPHLAALARRETAAAIHPRVRAMLEREVAAAGAAASA